MSLKCSIGKILHCQEDCKYIKPVINCANLCKDELLLLNCRVDGFNDRAVNFICSVHHEKYLKNYSLYFKRCSDALNKHKNNITDNLILLELSFCQDFNRYLNNVKLVPSQKICRTCLTQINKLIIEYKIYCDPFNCHGNTVQHDLFTLQKDTCEQYFKSCKKKLNTGKKVCQKCLTKIFKTIDNSVNFSKNDHQCTNLNTGDKFTKSVESLSDKSEHQFHTESQEEKELFSMFEALGVVPLKKSKLSKERLNNRYE